MGKRNVYLREFQCPYCKTIQYAPKKRQTAKGHEKKMWCYVCKKRTNFVQIGVEFMVANK